MDPMPQIPLDEDGLATWRGAVAKAREARKRTQAWRDENLQNYAPDLCGDPKLYGTTVNVNRDFTLVERKKADLFFQRPDVSAQPSPLFAGQEALIDTHVRLLNEKLGPDGVNAKALTHQVLFDVLCTSGTGWTVMGYETVTQDTPTMDPRTGQPTMVPVPVYQECFWRFLSPWRILKPHDFRSTIWDDAPWLGYEFEMPVRLAKRKGWVPDDYEGGPPSADLRPAQSAPTGAGESVASGVLIYYKSALYRDDRVHPQHYTLLVLMEGRDDPAEHKDSPYQTLGPTGELTPDSLIGNPIHPLTIRTQTDTSDVPSDCSVSRPLVNELNKTRAQQVEFREAAILRWLYNTDTLPPDALSKIVRSPMGGFVGVPGEAFVGEGAIKELPHGSIPRENFTINSLIDDDLARTHALDSNGAGVQSAQSQTATEAQLQQGNANARLSFERGIVLDWYCKGVTKYSTLMQRYLPLKDAAKIVGPQAAQAWDQWRHTIPSSLAFTALPDSALRTDVAWERKRAMDEYTFFANDSQINRAELLKALLPKLGYPQSIIQTQPPEKGPEPTKPTFSFKGDDLNPMAPQFSIVMEILRQAGVTVSPEAVAEAQKGAMNQQMLGQAGATQDTGAGHPGADTSHGGKVAQMESLSKHQNDQTGGLQGTGQPAPMGAGGLVQ